MVVDGTVPLLAAWPTLCLQERDHSIQPCSRSNGIYKEILLKSAKDDMDLVFSDWNQTRMSKKNDSATRAKRSLTVASVFCLLFMVAQAIGGYAAGSLAIMTDAAHLFSDFVSLMISLFSLCLMKKQPSISMTFGWHRAEVIGALVSLCMIWGITAALVFVAIARLRTFQFDIKAELMLITASIGLCFNIIMAVVLHKAGDIGMHGHSHGCASSHHHSHDDADLSANLKPGSRSDEKISKKVKEKHRLSVRAALLHVVSDFLQSSAVLVAAIVIYCKPNMAFIDPMCTFLFSILVLLTTIPILKEIITVLMEGAPASIDILQLVQSLRKLEGVDGVTNLRVWSLNTDRVACSVHVTVDVMLHNWRNVLENVTNMLSQKFHIDECTVQIVPLYDRSRSDGNDNECGVLEDE